MKKFTKLLGAILINPWNLDEIKRAIRTALTVTESQKLSDHAHLLSYVKRFTSSNWGKTFIEDLSLDFDWNLQPKIVPLYDPSETSGETVTIYFWVLF